jgi:tetratricopeptide (TPR) repeat protein
VGELHSLNLIFDRRLRGHLPVSRLAVSDAGSVIVAVPDDHQPRLYHLVRLSPDGAWEELSTFSVETLAHVDFSEDGRTFVGATDDDLYVFRDDHKSRLFPERRDNYVGVSISASGELFAVASADMILSAYSITLAKTSGGVVWTKDAPLSITCIQIAADASRLLAGSEEGAAVMLDGSRNTIWRWDGVDAVSCVGISDVLDVSIVGTSGGAVQAIGPLGNRLWEIVGGGPVEACAISRDGGLIAVGRTSPSGSGLLEFLDSRGTPLLQHADLPKITSVACSPSGRFAAVSCGDGTLQILELSLAPPSACAEGLAQTLCDEGAVSLEKGEYAEAIGRLWRALEMVPSHLDACRKLIEARDGFVAEKLAEADKLMAEGSQDDALAVLRGAAEVCPYNRAIFDKLVEARERLLADSLGSAELLADEGRLEEAIEKVESAIRLDPSNLQARQDLGSLEDALVAKRLEEAGSALEAGEAARAEGILERVAAIRSSAEINEMLTKARARTAFDEGLALYEAQKYSQAAFLLRKALSLDPSNEEAAKYLEYSESFRQDDSIFDRFSKLE